MKYYIYDLEKKRVIDIVNSFYNIIFPNSIYSYLHRYSGCYDPTIHKNFDFFKNIYIKTKIGAIYLSEIANHDNEYYNKNLSKNELFYSYVPKKYLIIDSLNRYISKNVLRNIFFENYNSGYYNYNYYNIKERNKNNKIINRKNYLNAAKKAELGEKTIFFCKYFKKKYNYIFREGSVPGIRRRHLSNCFRLVQTFSELKNRYDNSLKDEIENIDIENCTIRINTSIIRNRHIPNSRDDLYFKNERSWKKNSKAKKSWGKTKNKGAYI